MKLATLLKRCRFLVTSDSAPLHVAASVGTACIALFGPTDPARHLPPSEKLIVIRKDLKCSPCYKPNCRKGLICMKKITIDDILTAAEQYIK